MAENSHLDTACLQTTSQSSPMASQPLPVTSLLPVSDVVTTSWPRRAVKACASCRRDKIRCDGAKPCGACIKKGYSGDQCTDGCESCRRARMRCEGGKPCLRCRDMHLECVEEQSGQFMRSDSAPPVLVLRSNRRKSERAKLACLSCRRDNKKCDDQRPCSRCVARGEECVHVGRGPKSVKLRCENCRQENRKCEDARPCRQCTEQGKDCVTVQRRSRGHGTRVKTACANCRRDKVRCEGVRPCTNCTKRGYQCIDKICMTCARQGFDGECPHRSGLETDTLEPDVATEVNQSYLSHQQPEPARLPPSHPSPTIPGPSMFPPLHMYGVSAYHVSGIPPLSGGTIPDPFPLQGQHDTSSTSTFSRAAYYSEIDSHADIPQAQVNISSERYDPSSATTDAINNTV